ncbi:MAG: D-alanine--D-alanine ligase [Planctomycetota bacterium]
MKIAILFNEVDRDAPADERDVLDQMEVISDAVCELRHLSVTIPVGLDLYALRSRLLLERPDAVFNLVESLAGSDRLILTVPALLETLQLPFSGAPLEALLKSTNKVLAKILMRALGLPTADWSEGEDLERVFRPGARVIAKSRWSHGSLGLEEDAVLKAAEPDKIRARLRRDEGDCFVEEYIEGREFNLSVLGGAAGPEVLPLAEIRFDEFAPGRPRIVGYRAKWDPDSLESHGTPRTFTFGGRDSELLDRLRHAALACWRGFGLRGYARVDFRVDEAGNPYILEVNANPCLSRDAGFLAAAAEAGLDSTAVVARILADAPGAGGRLKGN